MTPEQELARFFQTCKVALLPDTPAAQYLNGRGYPHLKAQSLGVGYYRGDTLVPLENKQLRGFLWGWGEGKPAVVYPLRSLGGSLLGLQFGALAPGQYKDYFLPEASHRGMFFYPDTTDFESMYKTKMACVVEGALDACALHQRMAVVLSCLTAKATPAQVRSLHRWCDLVYCAFDNDEAGTRGHNELEKSKNGFRVVRVLPPVKDPQVLLEKGALDPWVRTWAVGSPLLRKT